MHFLRNPIITEAIGRKNPFKYGRFAKPSMGYDTDAEAKLDSNRKEDEHYHAAHNTLLQERVELLPGEKQR